MKGDLIKVWMPITKDSDGFLGILSDNSLDRDDEFMTKGLLESWASDSTSLPMLANHENKIEKLVGGWTDKQVMTKGEHSALIAKPFFLTSNPLGVQTKEMVEEALEKGLSIGISIGAIPHETIEKEINGVTHKGYSKAEIVEATIVPIQSNRNASFMSLAKSFNLKMEVQKMPDEEVNKDAPVEESVEEVKEEAPVEEKKEEVKEGVGGQEVVDENKSINEIEELKKGLSNVKKQLAELLEKADMRLAPTVESIPVEKEDNSPLTIEKQISIKLGGEK